MDSNELVNKRVHVIAQAHGCAIDDVHAVLDRHPIELDRDAYLRRTLALELLRLDQLEMAFEGKALRDGDVAAGVLMVKIAERRATLLGLNAPLGHSVHVVHNPAPHQPTATDKIEAPLKALIVISLQSREIRQCLQCCASRRHATFFGQCRRREPGGLRSLGVTIRPRGSGSPFRIRKPKFRASAEGHYGWPTLHCAPASI